MLCPLSLTLAEPPRPHHGPLSFPSPQITLGRATKDNQIDVDLALEGPAWKISRKQGRDGDWGWGRSSWGALEQGGLCSPLLSPHILHPLTPYPPSPHIPPPGVIKLKNNGDFFIANEGRRPIYIDGRPVLGGNKWKLNNNSVVEVSPDAGGGAS